MHAVRLAVGPGKEAFAPGAQQIAIVVEYGDRMLPAIEGIDIVLAVPPYCGAIPKRDLVRTLAQFSSTSNVHSPSPSHSAIVPPFLEIGPRQLRRKLRHGRAEGYQSGPSERLRRLRGRRIGPTGGAPAPARPSASSQRTPAFWRPSDAASRCTPTNSASGTARTFLMCAITQHR